MTIELNEVLGWLRCSVCQVSVALLPASVTIVINDDQDDYDACILASDEDIPEGWKVTDVQQRFHRRLLAVCPLCQKKAGT